MAWKRRGLTILLLLSGILFPGFSAPAADDKKTEPEKTPQPVDGPPAAQGGRGRVALLDCLVQ